MKRIRLLLGILLISIFICTICGLGQYSMPSNSYSITAPITNANPSAATSTEPPSASASVGTQSSPYDYSQYYTMASTPPNGISVHQKRLTSLESRYRLQST